MTDEYIVVQSYCLVRKDNHFFRVEEIVKKLIEQEQRVKTLEKENQRLKDTIDGLTGTMAHMEDLCDGDGE